MRLRFIFQVSALIGIAQVLLCPGVSHAGSVRLAWDPNPEPDIAGYVVFYGTQSRTYTSNVDVGNRTTGEFTGLADGRRYYFAVLAYNSGGLRSPLSDEVSTVLPGSATRTLTVTVIGAGTVTSDSPPGMSCGGSCTQVYAVDTTVVLTPIPQPGSLFAGWTGEADCTDGVVAVSADHACTATFLTTLGAPPTGGSLDLNGDGRGDVFRYNRATGDWAMEVSDGRGGVGSTSGRWPAAWQVFPADFNADGLTDLLLYNPTSGTAYELVNAAGKFTSSRADWSPGWHITVVDFDGDGRSDLFLYNPTTGAWFRAINGGLGFDRFTYATGEPWSPGFTITPGDFDGDGRADLFLYHPTARTWWEVLTSPSLEFTYAGTGIMSEGWTVTVADFNGDGRSDVFLYRPADGRWFQGITTGPGTLDWSRAGTWDPGFTITSGDFDGDGRGDLFLYHPVAGTWWQALSTPAGGFAYTGACLSDGWTVAASDLDGDRRSDLVLYRPSDGRWATALSVGPGTFTWTSGTWGPGWTIVASRAAP